MSLHVRYVVVEVLDWDQYGKCHSCMVLESSHKDLEWGSPFSIDIRYQLTNSFDEDPLKYIGAVVRLKDVWAREYMARSACLVPMKDEWLPEKEEDE